MKNCYLTKMQYSTNDKWQGKEESIMISVIKSRKCDVKHIFVVLNMKWST